MTLAKKTEQEYNDGVYGDEPAIFFLNNHAEEVLFDYQNHTATFADGSQVYVCCRKMEEI